MADGDTVVLLGHETGRIKMTGEAYDVQFVHRFVFVESRLATIRVIAART